MGNYYQLKACETACITSANLYKLLHCKPMMWNTKRFSTL